jgi:hypothetical protein
MLAKATGVIITTMKSDKELRMCNVCEWVRKLTEGPVGGCGDGIGGRTNAERCDFGRVEPCHAQPADGKEGVEYKEEDSLLFVR